MDDGTKKKSSGGKGGKKMDDKYKTLVELLADSACTEEGWGELSGRVMLLRGHGKRRGKKGWE